MAVRLRFTNAEGTDRARRLRRDLTPHEAALWARLRAGQLGVKFRRQQPIGLYITDFVCFECALIVELDGSQHGTPEARAYDAIRTEYLEGRAFRVLRFWNSDITGHLDGVLERIVEAVREQGAGGDV